MLARVHITGALQIAALAPLPIGARAKAFLSELTAAASAHRPASFAEAFALINDTMNSVEDRSSGIAWRPGMPFDRDAGRMLPLADDINLGHAGTWPRNANVRLNMPLASWYGTKGNDVLIADNGAFELWTLKRTDAAGVVTPSTCLLRSPSPDGRTITTG